MFREGYIATPPTMTVRSDAAGAGLTRPSTRPSASSDAPSAMDLFCLLTFIRDNLQVLVCSCVRALEVRTFLPPVAARTASRFLVSPWSAVCLDQFGMKGWAGRAPCWRTARRFEADTKGCPLDAGTIVGSKRALRGCRRCFDQPQRLRHPAVLFRGDPELIALSRGRLGGHRSPGYHACFETDGEET